MRLKVPGRDPLIRLLRGLRALPLAMLLAAGAVGGCSGEQPAASQRAPAVAANPLPVPAGLNIYGAGAPADTCAYEVSRGTAPVADRWLPAGPPGGNVTALLPLGAGTILAGTGWSRSVLGDGADGAGIYRSTDGGETFVRTLALRDTTVTSMARVTGTSRVYAAVGSLSGSADDGVYLSTDGGLTFSRVSQQGIHSGARPRTIAVAPGSPERVYLMVEGSAACPLCAVASLYRRDDTGDWQAVAMAGASASGGPPLAMAVDTVDRDRVLLANAQSFFASADGGDSFSSVAVYFQNVTSVHTDPALPARVVVTSDIGLAISDDRGASWSFPPELYGTVAVTTVAMSPGRIYAATRSAGLYLSTGGAFARAGDCLPSPEISAVAVAPSDPTRVWVGTNGGGVYRSVDQADTFVPLRAGIDELTARVVVTGSSASPVVWLLSGAGLFRSVDNGARWTRLAADLGTTALSDLAQDPDDPDRVLLATSDNVGGGRGVGLVELRVASGRLTPAAGFTGRNIAAVRFDPTDPNRVYAYQVRTFHESTGVPTAVFVSADRGASFIQTALVAAEGGFDSGPLAVAPDGTVYSGVRPTSGAYPVLWRSTDGGTSYATAYEPDHWVAYAVYANAAGQLFVVGWDTDVGVVRSTDGGATFTPFATGLLGQSAIAHTLAFAPGGGVLIATVAGPYYASNGIDFADFTAGLPAADEAHWVAVAPGPTPMAYVVTRAGTFWRKL